MVTLFVGLTLPQALLGHGEVGTVLGPLAEQTGDAVTVIGAVPTVLLLGLGMERTSIAVMNLVAERLPDGSRLLPAPAPLAVCLLGEALLGAGLALLATVALARRAGSFRAP